MLNPTAGRVRLARAVVVSGMVLSLSLGAHVVGGGDAPAAPLVLAVWAFVLLATVTLAGRRFTPVRLLAVLGAGQGALHATFGWLGSASCSAGTGLVTTGHAAHLGHGGLASASDATAVAGCLAGAGPAGHAAHGVAGLDGPALSAGGTGHGAGMLAAHVVATLVVALLVARGEAALWAAARALVAVLPVEPATVPLARESSVSTRRTPRGAGACSGAQRHATAAPRRGPPRCALDLAA